MIKKTKLFYNLSLAVILGIMISCSSSGNTQDSSEASSDEPDVLESVEPSTLVESVNGKDLNLRPLDFNSNDVTILFPAPASQSDMMKMIRLTDFDGGRVLPQTTFDQAIAIATGPVGTVKSTRHKIGFRSTPQRQEWVISAIRIDPGAPGLSQDIFDNFGKSPQIRLVAQPVRNNNGALDVDDISLHLVYAFHGPDKAGTCALHNTPDMVRFATAVDDLKSIKDKFASEHGVDTSGPLNVHPAFNVAGPEFKDALQDFLNTHLTDDTLFAVSIAGIPQRFEPWIFLAMENTNTGLRPIPSPAVIQPSQDPRQAHFSQMLNFTGDTPPVMPSPATRNLASIDCGINFPNSVTAQAPGAGTSTADSFAGRESIDIVSAVISDAAASHFFNTDCVSCHTETRKQIDDVRPRSARAEMVKKIAAESGIDPTVIPHGNWNVRVIGWAPIDELNNTPGAHATISRRAATETHEVIECFKTGRWHLENESCLTEQ